ncbi:hypothetical protein VP01_603g2 [Puccinia sorghi]|uniref:Uncharacterized protein n=1 Tax=Puccinia sorghi TaxID=27349 RepID=A0A0L6UHB5_9BASI|nr:hypothetical protein VP01_603g2 [Puccinia sorghi]
MKLSFSLSLAVGFLLSQVPALISGSCFAARDVETSKIQALKGGPLHRRTCFSKNKDDEDDYEDYDEGYHRRYARSPSSYSGDYGYGKYDGYSNDKYDYRGHDY